MSMPRTIEDIYEDFKARREGLLLALIDGAPQRKPCEHDSRLQGTLPHRPMAAPGCRQQGFLRKMRSRQGEPVPLR